jgi:hypothetical protein
MSSAWNKKRIVQKLNQYRIAIQPSAIELFLNSVPATSFDESLEQFIKHQLEKYQNQTITSQHVEQYFNPQSSSTSNGNSGNHTSSNGESQFDLTSIEFNNRSKFSNAEQFVQLQRERTQHLKNRLNQSNTFGLKVIPVNALISSRGVHSLFGTLTQKVHDKSLYLEDTTGIVKLNLDKCEKIGEGVFCAGMSVMINGEWNQVTESVNVSAIILPPKYEQESTGNLALLPSQYSRCVIIKDLYLDQVGVIEKLHTLFYYFANQDVKPDTMLIFLGSFVSPEFKLANPVNITLYRGLFAELVPLVREFPTLKIRFVSGNRDLCPGNFNGILPRAPVTTQITDLFAQMKHVKFCSDPCSGTWWNLLDVKVCADIELGSRLLRNNLFRVAEQEKITHKDDEWIRSWRTILRQRHLTPFELTVQPVYWELDQDLSLVSFLSDGNKSGPARGKVLIVGDSKRDWRGRVEEVEGVLVVCAPSWYHNNQYMIWDSSGIETQTLMTEMQD